MKIVLRKESNIPYYKQIYMQIVERVQSGMLSHGESFLLYVVWPQIYKSMY